MRATKDSGATRRQKGPCRLLPAGNQLPRKAPKGAAIPGLRGHAPAYLAERVFVPGVAVPMVLHPGDRRHARPTHLSNRMARGAAVKFWFQDLLTAVSADLDPSIQTRGRAPRPSARPVHARAEAQALPVFPRSQKSWSPGVREAYRGLPAGEWPSLGLRLLRKRQPPGGGAAAQLCPAPPQLKEGQHKFSGCARERSQAGAVPTGSAKNIQL